MHTGIDWGLEPELRRGVPLPHGSLRSALLRSKNTLPQLGLPKPMPQEHAAAQDGLSWEFLQVSRGVDVDRRVFEGDGSQVELRVLQEGFRALVAA